MDRINVDTDQIIPKQFLTRIEREGFGIHLFHDWRYLEGGAENPDFELNAPEVRGASILVAGDNFGCGSSREHAPWALYDYGFRVIMAAGFADIFHSNCFRSGILPVRVPEEICEALMAEIRTCPGTEFTVDLHLRQVSTPGGIRFTFEIDPFHRKSLMEGLDDIASTLKHTAAIRAFETRQQEKMPWLWPDAEPLS